MQEGRHIARKLRLAVLLPLLAGACLLYYWSQRADPRFYREKTREFMSSLGPMSIEELES